MALATDKGYIIFRIPQARTNRREIMLEVFYQVLKVDSYDPVNVTRLESVQGAAAAVHSIQSFLTPYGGWIDSAKIKDEITKLTNQFRTSLGSADGILLELRLRIKQKDNGILERRFQSVGNAGRGNDPEDVLRKFLNTQRLYAAPPSGWSIASVYLWVTKFDAMRIPPNRVRKRQIIMNAHHIIPRAEWGVIAPRLGELVFDWNYSTVVIHHSGNSGMKKPSLIEELHLIDHNWDDVGYHYLVHPEGRIYEGRSIVYKGSHVRGKNTGKIGILMMGDYDEQWWDDDDSLTAKHLSTLRSLIITLKVHFPLVTLGGHKDFLAGYSCPGNLMMDALPQLRKEVGLNAP